MDKRYDIDFDKVGSNNTPHKLKAVHDHLAWLKVFYKPLVVFYLGFLRFCNNTVYDLLITGQVCSLERMLNNRYDFTARRIYIDDGSVKPTKYIFQSAEVKPIYIRRRSENMPVYIYTAGENGLTADNFIVYVPLDIALNLAEIITLIRTKRLVGKRFKIQRF